MKKIAVLVGVFAMVLAAGTTSAEIIGADSFDYADGAIVNQYDVDDAIGLTGGQGWDWNNVDQVHTGTVSDWDNAWGTSYIENQALISNDGGAIRQYNGPTELWHENPDTDERLGAFRGTGVVYYGVNYTQLEAQGWAGISGFDFPGERLFFGMPGGQGNFGIDESGVGQTNSDIAVVVGETYRLVTAIDFDGDQVRMWVNPDVSDFDNGALDNSADVTRDYFGTNWNTAVRLASGGPTRWDDLVVATDFSSAVPEPATFALLGLGGLLLRRRK